MERGCGKEVDQKVSGEVEVEDLPQPEQPDWKLPAGYGGLSQLRHGCGGVDQLPGCPELMVMSGILKKL